MHVRTAFGVRDAVPRPRPDLPGPAWRCDAIVLRPVADTVLAAWSAGAIEDLAVAGVDGLRLARPVRASDGRRVVAGWAACHDVPGRVEPRHDDVIAASLRLHARDRAARAPAPDRRPRRRARPRRPRRVRREEHRARPRDRRARCSPSWPRRRRRSTGPPQLVHGDLFGTVLFDRDAGPRPRCSTWCPFWRPVEWAAAVVVVDALAWGGADPGILTRWAHLAQWPQMLLHALLFRLAAARPAPRPCTRESLARPRARRGSRRQPAARPEPAPSAM